MRIHTDTSRSELVTAVELERVEREVAFVRKARFRLQGYLSVAGNYSARLADVDALDARLALMGAIDTLRVIEAEEARLAQLFAGRLTQPDSAGYSWTEV